MAEDIEAFYEHYQRIDNLIKVDHILKEDYIESLRYARSCMEIYAKTAWGIEKPWENI